MNSSDSSLESPPAALPPLSLSIQGLGHVPSFKTQKRATIDRKTGRPRPITKREHLKWMQKATDSIESQLRSYLATSGHETRTGRFPRSLIASLMPLDDSSQWIKEERLTWSMAVKGEEGATLLIESV